MGGQPRDHLGERLRHLVGRFDRARHLLFQAVGTAVPEHRRGPGEIPKRRRVPLERAAGHTAALRPGVGEALVTLVAARTGEAAIDRETLVVEQRLAERALFLRERIVGRKRHRCRAAEHGLQRGEIGRRRPRGGLDEERGGGADCAAGEKRRAETPYHWPISLPAASSMRATSPSTVAASLTGVLGGIAVGNAFFSSTSPARTSLSAPGSFFCCSPATLSVMALP